MVFLDLFCAWRRLITQPRDAANHWPAYAQVFHDSNTSIAANARPRQWWLILVSLDDVSASGNKHHAVDFSGHPHHSACGASAHRRLKRNRLRRLLCRVLSDTRAGDCFDVLPHWPHRAPRHTQNRNFLRGRHEYRLVCGVRLPQKMTTPAVVLPSFQMIKTLLHAATRALRFLRPGVYVF